MTSAISAGEFCVLTTLLEIFLTLYLMVGGIERLPIAKIVPVHQRVTFLIIFFDDNYYLYIYYKILFIPKSKVGLKSFTGVVLSQGTFSKIKN